MLRISRLSVTFTTAQGEVAAVQDVSLEVARGECLGVVGESGAGKTQLFLATLGLLPASARVAGSVHLGREPLIGRTQRQLDRLRGARVGLIFQDPMTSLTPHLRVGEQIAEPIVAHCGASWTQARRKALALLDRVHVPDAARRLRQYPHELSGGMRQRVMIAIALACDPDLLIADEPTTALDVTVQSQILALFAQLKREAGTAMVLITHDFGAVAGVADRVAVMQSGRIVELDTALAVLETPRHEYTRDLLGRTLTLDSGPTPQPAAAAPVAAASPIVLGVSSLTVKYPRRGYWRGGSALPAVDDVSLELRAGEALGVVGESGSGKSTLARAALRLIRPTGGRVSWMGRPLSGVSERELRRLRRDMQIVFQDPLASLDPRMTVGAIVAEPLRVHEPRLDAGARAGRVSRWLARVGLPPQMASRYPHELSGGQCQRVGIARAMILGPRLLVCDEPVSALDATVQAQILDLLASLKSEHGMSILLVSHNLAVVRRLCDRVLVLYRGRMMELAGSGILFAAPAHPYTRELLDAVPVIDPRVQPRRLALVHPGESREAQGRDQPPAGCAFRGRCPHAIDLCAARAPAWDAAPGGSRVACHRWLELSNGMLRAP
ncbi:MAG TPA: ABC transporter ATP-binding protein [Steroidobacteraceae bacterium]|nr:ABC transporter ATP-binding protein [Steroidobacteraceae bacterium]